MHTNDILFCFLFFAAVLSFFCWPENLEKFTKDSVYNTAGQRLLMVLSAVHWLTGFGLLLWFTPTLSQFSWLLALQDSWVLILTSIFYTRLGWKYYQTAKWLKRVKVEKTRQRQILSVAVGR